MESNQSIGYRLTSYKQETNALVATGPFIIQTKRTRRAGLEVPLCGKGMGPLGCCSKESYLNKTVFHEFRAVTYSRERDFRFRISGIQPDSRLSARSLFHK